MKKVKSPQAQPTSILVRTLLDLRDTDFSIPLSEKALYQYYSTPGKRWVRDGNSIDSRLLGREQQPWAERAHLYIDCLPREKLGLINNLSPLFDDLKRLVGFKSLIFVDKNQLKLAGYHSETSELDIVIKPRLVREGAILKKLLGFDFIISNKEKE